MKKHKGSSKKIILSRLGLTLLSILVGFLLFQSISLFVKKVRVFKKVETLRTEKEALLKRKEHIAHKNELLESEFGKEALLRERFNISKPGEEVIIITEPKDENLGSTTDVSLFQAFLNLFRKK